jgi:hypothetical protein
VAPPLQKQVRNAFRRDLRPLARLALAGDPKAACIQAEFNVKILYFFGFIQTGFFSLDKTQKP